MARNIQNSAKYVIGIIVFLVMVALYFFVLADSSSSLDGDYLKEVIDDNKALSENITELKVANADYVAQIAALESTLADKNVLITRLELASSESTVSAKCDALPPSEELLNIQNKLLDAKDQYITCVSNLEEKNTKLSELMLENQSLSSTLAENPNTSEYSDKLLALNREAARLGNLVNTLSDKNSELVAEREVDQPLAFEYFSISPNYCNLIFSGEDSVCLSSIVMLAEFNSAPDDNMTVSLISPTGDVIGSKPIIATKDVRVEFVVREDEAFLAGDYAVRFQINNRFDRTEPLIIERQVIPTAAE